MSRCLRQSPGQVHDKVADTNHESWTFVICVCDFVGNLSRTLLQSRRNGIWAYVHNVLVSLGASFLSGAGREALQHLVLSSGVTERTVWRQQQLARSGMDVW